MKSYEYQTSCVRLCECVEVIFCLPQLATTGLQFHKSGSPIVQQISRYGDTPKYADIVDRDIGDIYRHMSSQVALINALPRLVCDRRPVDNSGYCNRARARPLSVNLVL